MIGQLIKYGRELYLHNKWNRGDILEYSEEGFRDIIKYAYRKAPFYKEFYNSKGIRYKHLDDIPINNIPIIDKDIVRKNFYRICTRRIEEEDVKLASKSTMLLPKVGNCYYVHTSGSTGSPTNFLYGKSALNILESNFARLSIAGESPISIKDFPIKSLYIAPVGSGYACTALAVFGMKQYKCKSVIINARDPIVKWSEKIGNYSPTYLSGYPSCLNLVAELQKKGEIKIKPKKIIVGGEPVNSDEKEYFKDVFGGDVIDYYGCTESIFIGAGTTYYEGIYLYDDLNYVEIDEKNRLIITPLYNKAFPLIRYQLSDVMEGFTKDGFGELPYTHINRVIGRAEELMWFTNQNGKKDFLHPLFIDDLNVRGIIKYQFYQLDDGRFILRCVKDSAVGIDINDVKKQINFFLKCKSMGNVTYEIKFVDSIPVNEKTGKTKLVIKADGV